MAESRRRGGRRFGWGEARLRWGPRSLRARRRSPSAGAGGSGSGASGRSTEQIAVEARSIQRLGRERSSGIRRREPPARSICPCEGTLRRREKGRKGTRGLGPTTIADPGPPAYTTRARHPDRNGGHTFSTHAVVPQPSSPGAAIRRFRKPRRPGLLQPSRRVTRGTERRFAQGIAAMHEATIPRERADVDDGRDTAEHESRLAEWMHGRARGQAESGSKGRAPASVTHAAGRTPPSLGREGANAEKVAAWFGSRIVDAKRRSSTAACRGGRGSAPQDRAVLWRFWARRSPRAAPRWATRSEMLYG